MMKIQLANNKNKWGNKDVQSSEAKGIRINGEDMQSSQANGIRINGEIKICRVRKLRVCNCLMVK